MRRRTSGRCSRGGSGPRRAGGRTRCTAVVPFASSKRCSPRPLRCNADREIATVEVVKVNHHCSSFSSNATYVDTLHPELTVVSVGNNSYGHPSPTVVARWDAIADVFQTQSAADNALIDGDVLISTTGVADFATSASALTRSVTRPMDEAGP